MPQDVLRKITDLPMPQTFGDQASIDKILVLVAAEMIIATLPNPGGESDATVHGLTALGRATALKQTGSPPPAT